MDNQTETPVQMMESPNHLERELASITPGQLALVTEVLKVFMAEIRQIISQSRPNSCSTCAFNPATDDLPGFAPTAYGLIWAICNHKLFLCHHNQPTWENNLIDPSKAPLCESFRSVLTTNARAAYSSATRAMEAIRKIVPTTI